jgi:NAD(P)-dependent dehydrogenase (short-subunit alcohol dehydrogenase family)
MATKDREKHGGMNVAPVAAPGDVILVTGGGRGIGAATARLAAQRGYAVAINYLANAEAAERVVLEIRSAGGTAIAIAADISREVEVRRLFESVDRELGRIAVLVNNAGIVDRQMRVDAMRESRVVRMFAVNVVGSFLCAREAILRMSPRHGGRGGAIVNVSSAAARLGSPGEYVDYAASKAAIDTLTLGLAKEVAAESIRVNAVRPGIIDTEIHADGGDPERVRHISAALPLGRAGRAHEVAHAILWLASPESSYCSGTILDVAGAR